jgi:hypothetical protein
MSPVSNIRELVNQLFGSSAAGDGKTTASVASTAQLSNWGFPLNNDSSNTISLPDGRKLGYAQYGSQTGRPIFVLHGVACSRFEAAYYHELGQELGARLIGVDRPGMGWSTTHLRRTLIDHAKDLEHLAKHLELNNYGVLV